MSEHSVIVWDLQTVPDLAAAARLFDMEGAAEVEVREALGSGFPKHPLRSSFNPQGRTMVKHADRWPPAYYRAINQLADVIATFPPEKVPPSSCGRLQTIWRSLSIGDIGPITRPFVMPASLITASKSESGGENAGEPARAWRPRHAHVRSLKGGSNGPPTCHPRKCQTLPLWWHIQRHILCERGKELCSITAAQDD